MDYESMIDMLYYVWKEMKIAEKAGAKTPFEQQNISPYAVTRFLVEKK